MKVVSVLKSGGDFNQEDVRKLKSMCERFVDCEFYCLTDVKIDGVNTIPLEHNWKGWWSKMELFRPDLFDEQVLYLDLDTVIVGDFSHFYDFTGLAMLNDQLHKQYYGSGVMMFNPRRNSGVYEEFKKNPRKHMNKYHRGGDQYFIQDTIGGIHGFQELFPNQLYSYKFNLCKTKSGEGFKGVPNTAKIVFFHGKPRPKEVNYLGY